MLPLESAARPDGDLRVSAVPMQPSPNLSLAMEQTAVAPPATVEMLPGSAVVDVVPKAGVTRRMTLLPVSAM